MRISTVVFVLKGGKYSLRYLYRKELSEKYEIYRRTKKSKQNMQGLNGQGAGGGATAPPKFWKTMEIRANARKNQENSDRFIRK
jgi:hypothetical protein